MIALFDVVKEVQKFLESEGWSYMLIGGLAVQFWGRVRTTQDVDICVGIDPEDRGRLVDAASKRFKLVPDDPEQFVFRTNVLPMETRSGVPVDLLCAWTIMEREAIDRAIEVDIDPSFKVRICSPEDLVIMKFISDRPRDREDVEGVLIRSHDKMDHDYVRGWLKQFAETLDRPELVGEYDEYLRRMSS